MMLINGPWHGGRLYLSGRQTLVFEITKNGMTWRGCYKEENGHLKWYSEGK